MTSELQETFMPNNLCARCDEKEGVFSEVFSYQTTGEPPQQEKLSFCSNKCRDLFVGGISAAKELTVY